MDGRVLVEVPEAAAQVRRGAHLPEQPVHALRPALVVGGDKGAKLLGQIEQDRRALKDPRWAAVFGADRVIHERRDLGVRVGSNKAAAKLLAISA